MAEKMTVPQKLALTLLGRAPIEVTVWGDKLMTRLPAQIRTRSTLDLLVSKGLASFKVEKANHRYDITPAGRRALETTHDR